MVVPEGGGSDEAADRVGEVLSREACWGFPLVML